MWGPARRRFANGTLESFAHEKIRLRSLRATIVLTIQDAPIMEVAIRKMGNSQGVLIPKPLLAQVGLEGTADLQVRNGVIEIRPVRRNPREGWAEDAERLANSGDSALVWPEFSNELDDDWAW
jgi:antitoxin MazE